MVNFVSLHTGLTALRAAQTGLDTAAHNIANAQTAGYSRQRLELAARHPHATPVGPVGAGVDVTRITRARDDFLDRRLRGAEAEAGRQGARAELLARTEAILGEPDQGLTDRLGAVWDAFEDLALDPTQGGARQQVVSALGSLTTRVRQIAGGWDQLEQDTLSQAEATVQSANDLLRRVAELNSQIPVASFRGISPNDLLDERDLLVDRLAAALGASATVQADETVTVRLGAQTLVSNTTAEQLTLGPGPGYEVRLSGGANAVVAAGGRLRGLQEFLTTDLPTRRAQLDAFSSDLAAELNARHAAGYALEPAGSPGGPLLALNPSAGAARTLEVAAAIVADPRRLAAAASPAVAPQDGRNAAHLANLRAQAAAGATFDQRLTTLTVGLAADVASSRKAGDAADGLRVAASNARSAVVAVSVDEEMVSIVQYQRSLEAASRVMTAVDQALDVLVNRTGLVGR